jgi:hypothetical protein
MKNTTLGRKAKEDMVKGAGEYKPRRTASQSGDGADFAFNGQMGDGVNGHGTNGRFSGNQSGLTMKERYGNGPRTASTLREAQDHGPSVTKDKFKQAPDRASGEHPTSAGKTSVKRPPNSDAIYVE